MLQRLRTILWAGLLLRAWSGEASPAALSTDDVEFFEAKIRPILVESCYKCHSAEAGKSKGDLQLDSREALLKGGALGPAILPGRPAESLLIQAIHYSDADLQMPPEEEGGKLPPEKIAVLEEWVRRGAPDPRGRFATPELDGAEQAAAHWAFQSVTRPPLPRMRDESWVKTPVDAFVLAQLEAQNLRPAPRVDKPTLLRRVTHALTGLPPTPAEVDAFVADSSPHAYDKVVDRLLASPRYGERWGRFWLDVARYADTKGYVASIAEERRYLFAYTYRDYVIRSFNEDKPFDTFIVEQLAADHLVANGADRSALAALGFLTVGRRFLNNKDDIIDDRIDVVSRGLLGLTVSCARCHDHKFEPIPTRDYYSLHGVFASSEEPEVLPLLSKPADTPAYRDYQAKKAALEAKIAAIEDEEITKFTTAATERSGDYLLAASRWNQGQIKEKFDVFAGSLKLNPTLLQRWIDRLKSEGAANHPILGPWLALAAVPGETFVEGAAAAIAAGQPVHPPFNRRVVAAIGSAPASLRAVADAYNRTFSAFTKPAETPMTNAETSDAEESALRAFIEAEDSPVRLESSVAKQLLRRQFNPRTAPIRQEIEGLAWTEPGTPLRAMALADKKEPRNSPVYLRGRANNPGDEVPRQFLRILSEGAPQPFMMGSGRFELAQQIASSRNPLTARVLVNRVWGWHFGEALVRTPSDFGVRTEKPIHGPLLDWLAATFVEGGWSIKKLQRAIVLSNTFQQAHQNSAAADLDPENLLIHEFPRRRLEFEALRDSLLAITGELDLRMGGRPDDVLQTESKRRTVYALVDRQNLQGMFRAFDMANPDATVAQRFITTVPQQALYLMNNPFVLNRARAMAQRAELQHATSPQDRINALYRLVLRRLPAPAERAAAAAFVDTYSSYSAPADSNETFSPWAALGQVLLLSNELAFVN